MPTPDACVHPQGGKWQAVFTDPLGRRHDLGLHDSRREAVNAVARRMARVDRELTRMAEDEAYSVAPDPRFRVPLIGNERRMPPDYLASILCYDPDTGKLPPALLSNNPDLAPRVVVRGLALYAHRVAWCLATGAWPKGRVTWNNGDKSDLRWGNLECAHFARAVKKHVFEDEDGRLIRRVGDTTRRIVF